MRPLLLKLDDSLGYQSALSSATQALDGRTVEATDLGPPLRLWGRPPALGAVELRLGQAPATGPELTFAGSGDFHHVTPMLLRRAMRAAGSPPVTVIHFDNHPDWVRFEDGMHCGSWVARVARMAGVERVITVGVCSADVDRPGSKGADLAIVEEGRVEVYPYREPNGRDALSVCGRDWPSLEAIGEEAFADLVIGRIPTHAVYITIDKDVLRSQDAATNWDQGGMALDQLERLIARVTAGRQVIGADVVGDWSTPTYGGGAMAAFLKRGETLIDQPKAPADVGAARALNQTVNLRLLDLFQRVAA